MALEAPAGGARQRGARLAIVVSAVLFSTGGAAIKATELEPLQIACLRSVFAVAALFAFTRLGLAGHGGGEWRDWRTYVVGAAYAATMLLYVAANRATTAAGAVFLQATAPLYLLILGPVFLKEKLARSDLVLFLAVALGLTLFFVDPGRPQVTAPRPFAGTLLGVAAGFTWALTLLGLRWLARSQENALPSVMAGNLLACLFALPFAFPVASIRPTDLALLVWLGVFQIALAYVFATRGLRHVSALAASLLFLIEPVLNPIWAWWFHAERPGGWTLAGGVLILGASVLATLRGDDR